MMVTFVSQCEKNALKKTRRVLDAFANRIGDNTWQTLITEDGLDTVKKMLRQTASRSTAVSCHWIRSRSRSQLLWVVGNKSKFNSEGVVPVNSTEKDLINSEYESNWKYLPLIKAFTALAALFHDWGKASLLFQEKLDPATKSKFKGDPLRHEWISCLLFSAFVKISDEQVKDENWLDRLLSQELDEKSLIDEIGKLDTNPLADLPDAAALIMWLIVSHHRLPLPKDDATCKDQRRCKNDNNIQILLKKVSQQWGYENRLDETEYQQRVKKCFEFPQGLISTSSRWVRELRFWVTHLKQNLSLFEASVKDGSWRVIAHHARLCLMLGDHSYSSKDSDKTWQTNVQLFANTTRENGEVRLKQKLDEHLVNVAAVAVDTAKLLPHFESEPPVASELVTLQKPKKYTEDNKKYRWQDDAVTAVKRFRQETDDAVSGFFVVNMASTGCGKTLANAKIMQALSDDQISLRYILALGLRTLTLQTGDEYRTRIGLSDSELAVLIGSKAVYQLHKAGDIQEKDQQTDLLEENGSESQESLLDDDDELRWSDESWQGILPEEGLTTVLQKPKDRALLYAPVLACTIDHIMAATETKRGGRYILPCLRLMSSDLVIDEIDDFSGDDLIAIGRLIHLAGMLGRKVMISSATIPPDLALGYFHAYQQGWVLHANSRNLNPQVSCAWVDEFKTQVINIQRSERSVEHYITQHQAFIEKRVEKLKSLPAKRKAHIIPLGPERPEKTKKAQYFSVIQQAIIDKHANHHTHDSETQRCISFGVVRVANIQPCVELTRFLLEADWPQDVDIRCMAYHSQQVLLLRHEQEQHLDNVLKRKEKEGESPQAFNDSMIRHHISQTTSNHLIFILVATPVEEVGRDHDFDWAVVEPSSYRSIIQLAGRVRRHRKQAVEKPNMALLQYNWKGFEGKDALVFQRPGYETDSQTELVTHDLAMLVDEKQLSASVDAIPRIRKAAILNAKSNLADLEHFATSRTLGCQHLIAAEQENMVRGRRRSDFPESCDQLLGYVSDVWWMTALPQYFKPFRKSEPAIKLHLVIENDKASFRQYDALSGWVSVEKILAIRHQPLSEKAMQKLWLVRDYLQSIEQMATPDEQAERLSKLYGEISFTERSQQNHEYVYNDQLGLVRVNE